MRDSLFPSDDKLPTWLHTTLLLLIVSPFSLFPLCWGMSALLSGHLEPISGPEPGQYFFGPTALNGTAARLAGVAFIVLGAAFASIAVSFSRFTKDNSVLKLLPWVLLAGFVALSFYIHSQTGVFVAAPPESMP
jgi:hypothetical protein